MQARAGLVRAGDGDAGESGRALRLSHRCQI